MANNESSRVRNRRREEGHILHRHDDYDDERRALSLSSSTNHGGLSSSSSPPPARRRSSSMSAISHDNENNGHHDDDNESTTTTEYDDECSEIVSLRLFLVGSISFWSQGAGYLFFYQEDDTDDDDKSTTTSAKHWISFNTVLYAIGILGSLCYVIDFLWLFVDMLRDIFFADSNGDGDDDGDGIGGNNGNRTTGTYVAQNSSNDDDERTAAPWWKLVVSSVIADRTRTSYIIMVLTFGVGAIGEFVAMLLYQDDATAKMTRDANALERVALHSYMLHSLVVLLTIEEADDNELGSYRPVDLNHADQGRSSDDDDDNVGIDAGCDLDDEECQDGHAIVLTESPMLPAASEAQSQATSNIADAAAATCFTTSPRIRIGKVMFLLGSLIDVSLSYLYTDYPDDVDDDSYYTPRMARNEKIVSWGTFLSSSLWLSYAVSLQFR